MLIGKNLVFENFRKTSALLCSSLFCCMLGASFLGYAAEKAETLDEDCEPMLITDVIEVPSGYDVLLLFFDGQGAGSGKSEVEIVHESVFNTCEKERLQPYLDQHNYVAFKYRGQKRIVIGCGATEQQVREYLYLENQHKK